MKKEILKVVGIFVLTAGIAESSFAFAGLAQYLAVRRAILERCLAQADDITEWRNCYHAAGLPVPGEEPME